MAKKKGGVKASLFFWKSKMLAQRSQAAARKKSRLAAINLDPRLGLD
jgi:hypothetical protein